jgi:hypothetical protein
MGDVVQRRLEDAIADIEELVNSSKGRARQIASAYPDRAQLAFQAEWHIRGAQYHFHRFYGLYCEFVREVSTRAALGVSVIFMYAPQFQQMLFEFYALVNLCRISLDNLRVYLKPLFRGSNLLPKSIRDVLKGTSTCPIYEALAGSEELEYLMDVRNCLVHYRSFATSDNAIVVEQGLDASTLGIEDKSFFEAMARADFRWVDQKTIAVHVLLPDRIFETDEHGGTRLARFTYTTRRNMMTMAREFAALSIGGLSFALQYLAELKDPEFEFASKKSAE